MKLKEKLAKIYTHENYTGDLEHRKDERLAFIFGFDAALALAVDYMELVYPHADRLHHLGEEDAD